MTESFDRTSFERVSRVRYFEDFSVDQEFEHHWGRTLTAADNVTFSTSMCCWLPMYLNVPYAQSHGHPDAVIHPMLVLCTVVGLSAEDLSEGGGAFLGLEDCTFHRPVYPGDTLAARSKVVAARPSSSRPGGIVSWHTEARQQHGDLVVDFVRTNLVATRPQP
ncbi:MAG: MaoC family dehydratase [Ilumatobacteraceae bacterium]